MQFDFKTEMTKRTDEELIKLLTADKENYLPEALAAAVEEFEQRNLSPEKLSSITKEVTRKKEIEDKKMNEPLDVGIKVITFLLPLILTLVLSGYYKSGGYDRKARELVKWTMYGFGFYLGIILLVIFL